MHHIFYHNQGERRLKAAIPRTIIATINNQYKMHILVLMSVLLCYLGNIPAMPCFSYMAKAVTGKGSLDEAPAAPAAPDKRKMLGKQFIEACVKLFGIREGIPEVDPTCPCQPIDFIWVPFVLLYCWLFYNSVIRRYFLLLVSLLGENLTVPALYYKLVDRHGGGFSTNSSTQPQITVDASYQLQVLRITFTSVKSLETKERVEELKKQEGQVLAEVKAAPTSGLVGVQAGVEFSAETTAQIIYTFCQEVQEYTAVVGSAWKYSGNLPDGGIQVEVRLREDDHVITSF